jgi:hypothetical protein
LNLLLRLNDLPPVRSFIRPNEIVDPALPVCDRCEDFEEIVVTVLEVPELGLTLVLCGACLRALPTGFQVT